MCVCCNSVCMHTCVLTVCACVRVYVCVRGVCAHVCMSASQNIHSVQSGLRIYRDIYYVEEETLDV